MRYCLVLGLVVNLCGLSFSEGFGTIVGTVTNPSGASRAGKERWNVQLRGAFFNTLNHSNFTNTNENYFHRSVNSGASELSPTRMILGLFSWC
jgi:hypothetical protein